MSLVAATGWALPAEYPVSCVTILADGQVWHSLHHLFVDASSNAGITQNTWCSTRRATEFPDGLGSGKRHARSEVGPRERSHCSTYGLIVLLLNFARRSRNPCARGYWVRSLRAVGQMVPLGTEHATITAAPFKLTIHGSTVSGFGESCAVVDTATQLSLTEIWEELAASGLLAVPSRAQESPLPRQESPCRTEIELPVADMLTFISFFQHGTAQGGPPRLRGALGAAWGCLEHALVRLLAMRLTQAVHTYVMKPGARAVRCPMIRWHKPSARDRARGGPRLPRHNAAQESGRGMEDLQIEGHPLGASTPCPSPCTSLRWQQKLAGLYRLKQKALFGEPEPARHVSLSGCTLGRRCSSASSTPTMRMP